MLASNGDFRYGTHSKIKVSIQVQKDDAYYQTRSEAFRYIIGLSLSGNRKMWLSSWLIGNHDPFLSIK